MQEQHKDGINSIIISPRRFYEWLGEKNTQLYKECHWLFRQRKDKELENFFISNNAEEWISGAFPWHKSPSMNPISWSNLHNKWCQWCIKKTQSIVIDSLSPSVANMYCQCDQPTLIKQTTACGFQKQTDDNCYMFCTICKKERL